MSKYSLYVADKLADESCGSRHVAYETYEKAAAAAKRIIDDFLMIAAHDSVDANHLLTRYKTFGIDPCIVPSSGEVEFSGIEYAVSRCRELLPVCDDRKYVVLKDVFQKQLNDITAVNNFEQVNLFIDKMLEKYSLDETCYLEAYVIRFLEENSIADELNKNMAEYYGTWKTDEVTCPECGWHGTGEQCVQGEMFRELFEMDCPNCSVRLFVITYPTIEESRQNWDKVSEADRRMVEAREHFLAMAEANCLTTADQLPDLSGDELVIAWDKDYKDDATVLRFGDQIIWREPSFYEGYDRFREVVEILSAKYGARLIDVVPTLRSMNDLFGDRLAAERIIDKARGSLWERSK